MVDDMHKRKRASGVDFRNLRITDEIYQISGNAGDEELLRRIVRAIDGVCHLTNVDDIARMYVKTLYDISNDLKKYTDVESVRSDYQSIIDRMIHAEALGRVYYSYMTMKEGVVKSEFLEPYALAEHAMALDARRDFDTYLANRTPGNMNKITAKWGNLPSELTENDGINLGMMTDIGNDIGNMADVAKRLSKLYGIDVE